MTITPDDLRALADGLANQNSHAERIAARYAASADMLDALREAAEYFDNRADADHDQDGFVPNAEMVLLTTVQTAIAKAERAEP